ncbi:MAG: TolC family protein [Gammaproteobacteria bacterium]|nr:TolC family protein [Gammaproteobacteria bacterium]
MKRNEHASARLWCCAWYFCIAALSLQVPPLALAEPAAVLGLAEARARTIADNPGLAEMQARYEALTQVAPQQSALPDPVVSLNAMNLPWDSFDRNRENMTQMQVGVSQMFPFPGKLGLREDIALFEAEAALYSVDEMRLNLNKNVSVAWWEIYFMDRALETVQRNQSLLRQFVEVARTKYEVGKGLQQDVLLAQLELSGFLDQEIRLQAMREQQVIRLNVLMDVSPELPVQLPMMVPQPANNIASATRLHELALSSRPVLSEKAAAIDASESRLELAEKDYYPDFKVGVLYGKREQDLEGNSRKDFLTVMFSVNIPLYAGTKQSKAVQQRARELAKSQYALTDERNLVMSAISLALADYRRATDQVALFGEGIIPQARQTVESMLAGYQVDEVDFLNLVRSQVTLFNYELQHWKAFTEVNQSITRLKAAVGEENIYE